MKKSARNTPSAYQTISLFCEEGSTGNALCSTIDDKEKNGKARFSALRNLIGTPLTRALRNRNSSSA